MSKRKIDGVELPEAKLDTKNKYKVPEKIWRKWTPLGKSTFNYLYGTMWSSQSFFKHPDAPVIMSRHWKTTAWNAAWIAADGASAK